ncbi:MAG TPA: hypothetical protein PLH94_13965 [Fimbriimonadaceae bacterium]|nr:hypothetical protein [Fimbriimonadaceae bacterium]
MKRFVLLLVVLVAGLIGCGKGVGGEGGNAQAMTYPGNWVASSPHGAIELELKSDGKYKLVIGEEAIEGTWIEKGGNVTLTPTTYNGMTSDDALIKMTKQMQETGAQPVGYGQGMQVWDLSSAPDLGTMSIATPAAPNKSDALGDLVFAKSG